MKGFSVAPETYNSCICFVTKLVISVVESMFEISTSHYDSNLHAIGLTQVALEIIPGVRTAVVLKLTTGCSINNGRLSVMQKSVWALSNLD